MTIFIKNTYFLKNHISVHIGPILMYDSLKFSEKSAKFNYVKIILKNWKKGKKYFSSADPKGGVHGFDPENLSRSVTCIIE